MLRFPYAIREFETIISGEYVYVDRTDRIRFMEEWGHELLFLRPRRFGKSLWVSILMDYYDVAKADDFQRLFGHLAIGQDPTPLHNQYMVMRWDFSRVRSKGTIEQIEEELHTRVNGEIKNFQRDYRDFLDYPVDSNPKDALETFNSLINVIQVSGHKLYLFVDEYDNFANEVMMSVRHKKGIQGIEAIKRQDERYEQLVTGEGMFKTFFKNLKSFGSGKGLDRTFITGVSPVVMNDVTSGANVFDDIYWFQELNDLCGFHEHEVAGMLASVIEEQGFSQEVQSIRQLEALNMMRTYYDGSWFTTEAPPPAKVELDQSNLTELSQSRLYNPTMVFYFLRYLQRTGKYPRQMLDRNLLADRGKLTYITNYAQGRGLLVETLNGQEEISVFDIGTEFGADELLQEDMAYGRLASLLCYLGALTINGTTNDGQILLTIPNLVMQKMYAERILQMAFKDMKVLRNGEKVANRLFREGNIEPLCDFIEANIMHIYSNRDYPEFKELVLKSIFIAMLYHHPLYMIFSEPELHRRYGDLLMLLGPNGQNSGLFNLLFEFKQLPLHKVVEEQQEEQLSKKSGDMEIVTTKKKLTDQEVRERSRAELLQIPAVREAMDKAKGQIFAYQKALYRLHGSDLKLCSYGVVGVGFGRIVFEAVDSELTINN